MTFVALLFFSLLSASGCGPKYTYPANTVPKSIEEICKKEYKLFVTARVVGKTAGALAPVSDLIDTKGQLPQEVHERMGKVMQVVTRVALSTDRPIDFCTVILRDRTHGAQLSITRSLDDTKRANADVIGIEESMNRTLFSQENFEPETPDKNAFILKEIKLPDFLQSQIIQRVRFSFTKGSSEDPNRSFSMVDGAFEESAGQRVFRFSTLGLKSTTPHESILVILRTVKDVLKGYSFTAFDSMEIQDYLNRQKLTLSRQTFLDYGQKKITEEEILKKYLTESQSIQEAFKLFGFNLPLESGEEAAKSVPTP